MRFSNAAHLYDRVSMASLLPTEVSLCEYPRDVIDGELHLSEADAAASRHFTRARRAEFHIGRTCARRAMARFDRDMEPVSIGHDRAPIWPRGVVGSITHCPGYCAAAVADTANILGLGIDAEIWTGFPACISSDIANAEEYRSGADLSLGDSIFHCLLFSAKESIFKAINPLINEFFDYRSVSLSLNLLKNSFSISSTKVDNLKPYIDCLSGKYMISRQYILTSALVIAG
jgi:4'-phosphopantetheinyl transferase EntD